MKWIGLFLLVLCGAGIGFLAAKTVRQEQTAAERCCQMLREWSVQMAFRCSTVQELLEQVKNESAYGMFSFPSAILESLSKNQTVQEAWKNALEHEKVFSQNLKQLLLPLGDELGQSDLDGQLSTLAQYQLHLEQWAQQHKEKSSMRQRLYFSLGILGGLMAAILFC